MYHRESPESSQSKSVESRESPESSRVSRRRRRSAESPERESRARVQSESEKSRESREFGAEFESAGQTAATQYNTIMTISAPFRKHNSALSDDCGDVLKTSTSSSLNWVFIHCAVY